MERLLVEIAKEKEDLGRAYTSLVNLVSDLSEVAEWLGSVACLLPECDDEEECGDPMCPQCHAFKLCREKLYPNRTAIKTITKKG